MLTGSQVIGPTSPERLAALRPPNPGRRPIHPPVIKSSETDLPHPHPLMSEAAAGQPIYARTQERLPRVLVACRPLLTLLRAIVLVLAVTAGPAALYLFKSALGINLLAGPSPLHDMLYPLLGRG